ncbi:MAG: D-alanine--D-alanine ligase [Alphaproteobacteria bacterium]
MTLHVALLKGGWSAEREVSLNSGAACANALRANGYKVTEIDVAPDIAAKLAAAKPDVVFNALHGRFGEDGCVQGMLELMGIPYTHSGVLASAVAMDKPMAKRVFEAAGLRCPGGVTLTAEALLSGGDPLPRPFVVKPADEGSSVGVVIVTAEDSRPLSQIAERGVWSVGQETSCATRRASHATFLVEEYIPGREITVAVLSGKAMGVTEIRPLEGFYDYTNKYTDGKTEHLCPAPLTDRERDHVMQLAERAHVALGCRGLTRSDFRYDGDTFYLLEINTQPGMTALSLSPEIAAHAGVSFNELVRLLVEDALQAKHSAIPDALTHAAKG